MDYAFAPGTTDYDGAMRKLFARRPATTSVTAKLAKHPSVDRLVGSIALSKNGVPFDALDGEPVHVFVMLISPQDRPGDHLRALENVSRSLRDDGFVRALRQAPSREAVWDLLGDMENPV